MHAEKHYVDYANEIRQMRARYVAALLKSGWSAMIDFLRSGGPSLAREETRPTPAPADSGIPQRT